VLRRRQDGVRRARRAGRHGARTRRPATAGAPLGIFFAVAVDLFTDGVLIGTGATIASPLALLLALGRVPANVPEGSRRRPR
jgi:ZIP family zinc transporter